MSRPQGTRSLGCEFKAVYYSNHEAEQAKARLEETSEAPLSVYFCHEHGGWHLTSTPQGSQ